MDILLQQIINGLVLGSMYALVALGYTMVYGIIGLINFAHGDVLMVGALTSWSIIVTAKESMPGVPGWVLVVVAILISMVVCSLLNFTIEKLAYRPLRNSPRLAPLITAMRATAENPRVAGLMGIKPDVVISATFIIGACLAALAGVMWAANYGTVQHSMGFMPGLKAFTAAVFGGIGNLGGAVVGGIALGLIEGIGAGYLGALTGGFLGSQYTDIFAFIVLILVLTVRPSGLLGERVADRA